MIKALARELREGVRERRRHRPAPPDSGLVVDVGGGQAPHPRTDVLVDKYVLDSFERPGEAGLSLDRPLVVADAASLPFADGAFAYSVAQHVLEHAPDPVVFAAELSRVSAAGFVQVPSRESELTFGWPYHGWLIDRRGDTLVFEPKGERRAPLGDDFHQWFAESPLMRLWWQAHRSRWHHSVHWQGELRVEVAGEGVPEQTAELDVERTVAALTAEGSSQPLPGPVRAALRCPSCGGALADDGDALRCEGCHASFPVAGHVPVLIEEAKS